MYSKVKYSIAYYSILKYIVVCKAECSEVQYSVSVGSIRTVNLDSIFYIFHFILTTDTETIL